MVVIAALAVLWTAYFAKPVLAPMAIGLLLKFLLSPLVRWLKRTLRVPLALSAALIAGGSVAGLFAITVTLAPAVVQWTEEFPERLHRLESRMVALAQPVAAISAATEKVGEKVDQLAAAATSKENAAEEPTVVRLETPSLLTTAFNEAQRFAIEFLLVVVMLYLLLIGDGLVLSKLQYENNHGAKRWATVLTSIESSLSTYVSSMLIVHGCLGLLMAVVLWLIGMPSPLLWGLAAGIANAVPFVGPLAVICTLSIIGLTTFDEFTLALASPAAYLTLHTLETWIVTPCLLGRWLSLSPVAIFIALVVMGFVWGLAGLLLAVPILVALKIICENVPALMPLQVALDGTRPPDTTPRPASLTGTTTVESDDGRCIPTAP